MPQDLKPSPEPVHAILLSIGDELVLGQTIDTNTAWLAQRLAGLGLTCHRHETVADDLGLITDALKRAARDAALVVVTGGLGPTDDDLTRQALADALGVGLEPHEPSLRDLEAFFTKLGRTMADRNRVQAMRPAGADMIPNPAGTAPGIHAELPRGGNEKTSGGHAHVYVTPGVPREMRAMFKQSIEPEIKQHAGTADTLLTTKINTFGLGESDVATRLGGLMARGRNPTVGTTVAAGLCSVRIRARHADTDTAHQQRDETVRLVHDRLGPICFGRDDDTLQDSLVNALRDQKRTVATAESCTGGLVGSLITDVPGSSAVYAGGWVTYSNEMKTAQLGVAPALLEQHGAVSGPVAQAMAHGTRQKSGADFALSLTGIAGPDGGTPDKPVGTVWIGLATPEHTAAYLARLVGNRQSIRDRASKCAMQILRLTLLSEDPLQIQWITRPGG